MNYLQRMVAKLFRIATVTPDQLEKMTQDAYTYGLENGRRQSPTTYSILPLPFTSEQLLGREYGTFISPHGFGLEDGMAPAPGPHGYEQRFYYADRASLNAGQSASLLCEPNPIQSDDMVPVIVTVLR